MTMSRIDSAIDVDALQQWVGRSETHTDLITAAPLARLAATLDRDAAPSVVPALWHWLYFLGAAPMAQLGVDGHPVRGGFLPPVPLPRRMWAASRIEFSQAMRVGDTVTRRSQITDVQLKEGRSGALVFVKLLHELLTPAGDVALGEAQEIVYRDDPRPTPAGPSGAAPAPPASVTAAPPDAEWRRELTADPVLLFRYSALTFNGHRIHYDRPYATGVEGYPGLVVHGPLIATLLVDHLHRHLPAAHLRRFEFRALRPLFDGAPFELCGRCAPDGASVQLWARDAGGALCMDALATLG